MTARTSRAPSGRRHAAATETPPPSRLLSRPAWQQHLLALAALWLVLGATFPEIAWRGRIFASPDYESPSWFAEAGRAALRSGEYPLWNPYLFLGMPSYASLAFTPWVHPPSEILAALGRLPGAPPLLWLLAYYLAAGYGVFLVLRVLGAEFWAALLGGVVFMLTPHLVSWGVFGHGSKLASVAYLPYLLLLVLRLAEPGRRLLWSALLGAALGLQLLRGHPQIAFYGLLLLGLVTLVEITAAWRRPTPVPEILRFAAGVAGGIVLGFGVAAVLLLPVRAYAPVSIRGAAEGGGAAYQYATNWSFSPGEIATFFVPSAAGFGEATYVGSMPFTNFPNYLGQAVLLFGAASLVLLRGRRLVLFVVVALFALCVSFGRNLPLVYDLLYRHLPYFNKFRVPVMILVLLQLAAALLAGVGLTALWGRLPHGFDWRRAPNRRDAVRALVAAAVVAVVLVVAAQPWSAALGERVARSPRLPVEARGPYAEVARRMLQGDALRGGVLLVAHAGVVLLLWRRKLPADLAGALLVVLAAFDLAAVDRRMVAPEDTWPGVPSRVAPRHSAAAEASPLARWILARPRADAAPPRVLPAGQGFMSNEWMRHGISSVGGYHPAKPARFESLVNTSRQSLDPRLLDLFAVRWVVVPEPLPQAGAPPAYEGPDGVVYENPRALPHAWVTGRWALLPPGADCKARLLADDFDRRRVALLESPPAPAPDSTATGSARFAAFGANRLVLEVNASAPALLVLAESYHPGWRARVGGVPAPVLPVDCTLRAVAVPAGTSRVEMWFTDPALATGRGVTLASLGCVLLLAVLGARPRRRAGAPAATEVAS